MIDLVPQLKSLTLRQARTHRGLYDNNGKKAAFFIDLANEKELISTSVKVDKELQITQTLDTKIVILKKLVNLFVVNRDWWEDRREDWYGSSIPLPSHIHIREPWELLLGFPRYRWGIFNLDKAKCFDDGAITSTRMPHNVSDYLVALMSNMNLIFDNLGIVRGNNQRYYDRAIY